MKVAALFVDERGPYVGIDGVDPWTRKRDARLYVGPWPVVAHPPCERWGRYWSGGPSARVRKRKGDDDGCFAAALTAVRIWGGVLEHPAHSAAWEAFGLLAPPASGGWVAADWQGGFTCQVEQGHYGHPARKATWLYAKAKDLPALIWGPSRGLRLEDGFHSSEERARARARCRDRASQTDLRASSDRDSDSVSRSSLAACSAGRKGMRAFERLSKRQRVFTPVQFRDLLLEIAGRSV